MTRRYLPIFLVAWLLQCPVPAQQALLPEDGKPAPVDGASTPKKGKFVINYNPPKAGAPASSVRSITRGSVEDDLILMVVAPPHPGRTISTQPTLYWYQSKPGNVGLQLFITDMESKTKVLEHRMPAPSNAGFGRIELARHNVKLQPGKRYEWSVKYQQGSGKQSKPPRGNVKKIVTFGSIDCVEPSKKLTDVLRGADNEKRALALAGEGIWYDAFAAIADLISTQPKELRYRKMRDSLMRQGDLPLSSE